MITTTLSQNLEACIVRRWMSYIEKRQPGIHYTDYLIETGHQYVRLLLDTDIPLDDHPAIDIVPRLCEYHAKHGTPVEAIVYSSHCWRRAIVETSCDTIDGAAVLHTVMADIHLRIDALQLIVVDRYGKQREAKIPDRSSDELHDDRLSLLGKMAAAMAHEIRNPLFAIEGFLKLIKAQFVHVPEQAQNRVNTYMEVVEKEFDGLYRQITSFLSFSKQGDKEESAASVSIGDIIDNAVRLLAPRAANENIELIVRLEYNPVVLLQPIAIQQVLTNLINNGMDALADSQLPKRIDVSCGLDGDRYRIIVSNNGPAIPEAMRNSIFEPFVTTKKNGTGLGLSICRQIMQRHGGDLTYTPLNGETAFSLTFPLHDRNAAEPMRIAEAVAQ